MNHLNLNSTWEIYSQYPAEMLETYFPGDSNVGPWILSENDETWKSCSIMAGYKHMMRKEYMILRSSKFIPLLSTQENELTQNQIYCQLVEHGKAQSTWSVGSCTT